ncbi:MAG: sensor histidine kinase, partial [Bacteroidota bacterium]
KTRLEIKEQTLKNISLDIHDNVGQILSLANLSLSSLDLKQDDPLKDKIENVMALISKSIHDLRNLSKTLDPDNIAKEGLSACVQFELSLLEKMGVFVTRFHSNGREPVLDSSKKLLIYRIVQEAINNIIKHAKATEVDISISCDKNLSIHIQDNGIGFDQLQTSSKIRSSGAGLQNMAYRARLMKGNLFVDSAPHQGTKLNLEIPLMELSTHEEK